MQIIVNSKIKIRKDEVSDQLLRWISKRLRFNNPEYKSAMQGGKQARWAARNIPRFIFGYRITEDYVIMDRGVLIPLTNYLYENDVEFSIDNKTISKKHEIRLNNIKLRDYQQRAVQRSLRQRGGVVIQPCGGGKTITLLGMLKELQETTLIFVHTTFLLNQWVQYIKDFLGYDAGIIQGETEDIKPITVCMIQTLYNRKITKQFAEQWGCVIVDEAHHVPANMFRSIVSKFPARYRFGASATVNRSDSLTQMIFSILGPRCYRISSSRLSELGYIRIPTVMLRETEFTSNGGNFSSIVKQLISNEDRNQLIISDLANNQGRFNLVLSSRIEHLKKLASLYSQHSEDYEVVIGDVKSSKREEIINRMRCGQLHTIFATQLADEGLDIPILDTLYLAFPTKAKGRIEQRVGRIQRIADGKSSPLVYDYSDNWVTSLFRQSQVRVQLYQELELNISNGN